MDTARSANQRGACRPNSGSSATRIWRELCLMSDRHTANSDILGEKKASTRQGGCVVWEKHGRGASRP